jgi:hypothetical protein
MALYESKHLFRMIEFPEENGIKMYLIYQGKVIAVYFKGH